MPKVAVSDPCKKLVESCVASEIHGLLTLFPLVATIILLTVPLAASGFPFWLSAICIVAVWSLWAVLTRLYSRHGLLKVAYRDVLARIDAHEKACREFNARLESVQAYAKLPGTLPPEVGAVQKMHEEAIELHAISDDIELSRQKRERELALAEMTQKLTAAPNQGQFRETRDVSDLVYANTEKLRVDSEELDEMLADDPTRLESTEAALPKRLRVD